MGSIIIGNLTTKVLGSEWLGIFSGVLTFLIIVFGEIVPKTLGQRYAEPICLFVAIPIRFLTIAFTPLVWLVENATSHL